MSDILHDAHFHILDKSFSDNKDLHLLKDDSQSLFLLNGTEPKYWDNIIKISKHNKRIIPFLGIHPWYVSNSFNDYIKLLENYLIDISYLGIGEIGLDFSSHTKENEVNLNIQEEIFYNQLMLAIKYKRPISFHVIKKWDRFFYFLKKYTPQKFMIHGFTQSKELAKEILNFGGYISIGLRAISKESYYETIRWLPIDKILIESDETISIKDICSEIHYSKIKSIYNQLAIIRGVDISEIALSINNNINNYLSDIVNAR